MKIGQMQRLSLQVALLQVFLANAVAADELFVFVHPEEAQEVIERNEMQYEEMRWHSFPDRIRIAKIRVDLLRKPDAEFTISLFDNIPPIYVKSNGITGNKWTGTKTRGGITKVALKAQLGRQGASERLYDQIVWNFNTVELYVGTLLRDRDTGEVMAHQGTYYQYQSQYKVVPAGEEMGPLLSNVPVFSEEHVEEVSYFYGDIGVFDSTVGVEPLRGSSIRRLDNDADYVMICEFDQSKNHHLMDPPINQDAWEKSELGQRYKRLRNEKKAYLDDVEKRIAERSKERNQPN